MSKAAFTVGNSTSRAEVERRAEYHPEVTLDVTHLKDSSWLPDRVQAPIYSEQQEFKANIVTSKRIELPFAETVTLPYLTEGKIDAPRAKLVYTPNLPDPKNITAPAAVIVSEGMITAPDRYSFHPRRPERKVAHLSSACES